MKPIEVKNLRRLFDLFDLDEGGTLDATELRTVLAVMGKPNIDECIAEMDEDNVGEVQYDEFLHWFATQGKFFCSYALRIW